MWSGQGENWTREPRSPTTLLTIEPPCHPSLLLTSFCYRKDELVFIQLFLSSACSGLVDSVCCVWPPPTSRQQPLHFEFIIHLTADFVTSSNFFGLKYQHRSQQGTLRLERIKTGNCSSKGSVSIGIKSVMASLLWNYCPSLLNTQLDPSPTTSPEPSLWHLN